MFDNNNNSNINIQLPKANFSIEIRKVDNIRNQQMAIAIMTVVKLII